MLSSSARVCGLEPRQSRHTPCPRFHRGLWDCVLFWGGKLGLSTLSKPAGPSRSLPDPVPSEKGRRIASVSPAQAEGPQPASSTGKVMRVLQDSVLGSSLWKELLLAPTRLRPSALVAMRASAQPFS